MITIGITGGIGSGKSIVSTLMELSGIPVYIADEESKRLTQKSPAIRKGLTDLFGETIYTPNGLDKKKLAGFIFNDPEILQKVNNIIHPEVFKDFISWTELQHKNICALESAILFESGFNKFTDITLLVYAPEKIRIQRAMDRDHASMDEVKTRVNNQLSDDIKKEKANYIIYNDGVRALIPQVKAFIEKVQNTEEKGKQSNNS